MDAGTITDANMQTELARQMREDVKNEVSTSLRAEFDAKEQAKHIQGQFDGYVELRPDVLTEGTDDRRRVQAEFQALTKLGYSPQEKRTEVIAMRTVLSLIHI